MRTDTKTRGRSARLRTDRYRGHGAWWRPVCIVAAGINLVFLAAPWPPARTNAQNPAQVSSVVNPEVDAAMAASLDGRVYVVILLEYALRPPDEDLVVRRQDIAIQQQSVLDLFEKDEFELIYRPDSMAALTGRINRSGLAKLATHALVAEVGLDAMNCGVDGICPPGTGPDDFRDTSWFVLTRLLDRGRARAVLDPPIKVALDPQFARIKPERWCATERRWAQNLQGGILLGGGACPTNGVCDTAANRDLAIPDGGTPLLILRLMFHIFCADNGTSCKATEQDVVAQIAQLNADYLSSRIQFVASGMRFIHDTTYWSLPTGADSNMKTAYALAPDEQINVYVVNIEGIDIGDATLPWEADALASGGGAYIDDDWFGSGDKTLTHELGHCVGLYHTHRGTDDEDDGGDPANAPEACDAICYELAEDHETPANNETGDFCNDTPPTPDNLTCSQPGGNDPCGEGETSWAPTLVENYMGLAPDSCYDSFTAQQMGRMHCWIEDVLTGWYAGRWIDPLTEDTGVSNTPALIDSITLEFEGNVFDWSGFTLGTDDFEIECTNANGFGNPCPDIDSVSVSGGTVTINLDGVIPYGEWTKLTGELEDANAVEFTYVHHVAHLPCDVNQDKTVNIKDATAFGDEFFGLKRPDLVDTNRSGTVNVSDATAFASLWNGDTPFETWNGVSLPAQP